MIIKSISYVTIGLILGRLTSFIKHAIIVKYTGITYEADIFFLVNTIPETVINVIIAGILTGAFIPLASQELATKGNVAFKKFVNNSFYIIGVLLLALSGFLFVFSGIISQLLAPGYEFEQQKIVANMLKILSPGILFIGLAAILTGTLQSIEKFFIPSFGLFIANLSTIVVTILFYKEYGIYAAAIGTSIGFFLWFLYQIPYTFKYLMPVYQPDIKSETIRKLFHLTIPTILIIAINNFVLVIEKVFATELVVGTITELNLAFRLALIFSSILVLPLGTVLLPKLSKQYTKDNLDEFFKIIRKAFLFVSILSFAVVMIVLINAQSIAGIIYAPIGISNQAINHIAEYLRLYVFGFLGLFFYPIVLRVFFATQKVKYLLIADILGFISYLFFVILLISHLQSYVLPLGYGIYYFVVVLFLFWIMNRNISSSRQYYLNKFIFKTGFVFTGITLLFVYYTMYFEIKFFLQITITILFIGSFLFVNKKYLSGLLISRNEVKK